MQHSVAPDPLQECRVRVICTGYFPPPPSSLSWTAKEHLKGTIEDLGLNSFMRDFRLSQQYIRCLGLLEYGAALGGDTCPTFRAIIFVASSSGMSSVQWIRLAQQRSSGELFKTNGFIKSEG
jgi:hypothetical protein